MNYRKLTRDQHFSAPGPKRILALDGGGLKGIVTLGFLADIESRLRTRHGGSKQFRLAHYFDLIAGTSTGAIIATALAMGMTVAEVTSYYLTMGNEVFERNWFRKGMFRARYDENKLKKLLKEVFGAETTLGDKSIQTGLLVITKRIDSGSPWPLGNNPHGKYYSSSADGNRIGNAEYPLWQVVRASSAAPNYFDPEALTITRGNTRKKAVTGLFVDGGVSPFNNPALQAVMYATLKGYQVNWPKGGDNLLVVSVGTGDPNPEFAPSKIAAKSAIKALLSLMDDCSTLVETTMQWMSSGSKVKHLDQELGDLCDDLIAPAPLFTYVRYNTSFTPDNVARLKPGFPEEQINSLSAMDETKNLMIWKELGELASVEQVDDSDFPEVFNLS